MLSRLVLLLALCFQVSIALASEIPSYKNKNPNLWTAQESMDSWKDHLKNQERYAKAVQNSHKEVIAGIQMGVEGKQNVQQMLERASTLYDGTKITEKAVITQTPNKSKVAEVLTNRWKQAKSLGKASLPTFVGMAAFHGLIEGIGWVMDEGGKVTIKDSAVINPPYYFRDYTGRGEYTASEACFIYFSQANTNAVRYWITGSASNYYCNVTVLDSNNKHISANYHMQIVRPYPDAPSVDAIEVDYSQVQIALQQALLNNNAMQAAMIAEAIKDAYSYDKSQANNPASNTLAKEAAQDAEKAIDQAYKNPKPNTDPKRPSGYYKLEDHETGKVIEGYVEPSQPKGSITPDLIPVDPTNPNPTPAPATGSSTLEFPKFCDWAAIVCDWIDWTQKDPDEPESEEPEIPSDQGIFDWKPNFNFSLSGQCPADIHIAWNNKYFSGDHVISLQWLCMFFTFIGYALVFASHCVGIWILYEVASTKQIKW